MTSNAAGPRIVILGAGFAGAYCAQRLEKTIHHRGGTVLLVDHHNYLVFTPLLTEAGTGVVEPRHAVVPIRDFLRRSEFRMAEVVGVDADQQEIEIRLIGATASERIAYDHLVLALGSVTARPPVPGLKEHAFELKHLKDAVALRDQAVGMLELANGIEDPETRRELLHWVVVGASFSGAEVAGEYVDYLRRGCREYAHLDPSLARVTLIDHGDRILKSLPDSLSRHAEEDLRRRGVDIRLGDSVQAIGPRSVTLESGESLATRTVIWTAGVSPHPLLRSLPFPTDRRGAVLCEPDLRVQDRENVWAVGDCASNPDPAGRPYPATAQHAVRLGRHLADNLCRALDGRRTVASRIHSLGSLASLGGRRGVANVLGVRVSGVPAWFLWRTVYWMKMPGASRKVRVGVDWALELLYSHDFAQIGTAREPTLGDSEDAGS